jgi:hypothetical protein
MYNNREAFSNAYEEMRRLASSSLVKYGMNNFAAHVIPGFLVYVVIFILPFWSWTYVRSDASLDTCNMNERLSAEW